MKVKAHIRIARQPNGKPKIAVNTKHSDFPLTDVRNEPLPTLSFAVEFDVDDAAFRKAQQVIAEIKVTKPDIAATVKQVDP